jgi:hypothetical protein
VHLQSILTPPSDPDEMSPRGDLAAAHRGYLYQDLITSCSFVEVLTAGVGSVTVDKKVIPADRFDDVSHRDARGLIRRQIKWSAEGSRTIALQDFVGGASSVRIDHLALSYLNTPPHERAREYRLAVAWNAPDDPDLLAILKPTNEPPAVPGTSTKTFRLRGELIWPEGDRPVLSPLDGTPGITRDGFLAFASDFILETDLPPFSADLSRPGALERVLCRMLLERVGIGEYPNDRRSQEDVAARLVALAAAARTEHATLTAQEIAHAIDLRVDFGRVPQRFPIQREYRVERLQVREALGRAIRDSPVVTLIGAPGSGKSWELSALADELQSHGILVARHYCYLEPGDPDIERRITTNVLLGNLVSELLDADASLADAKQRTFAATLDELERVLRTAAKRQAPNPVVLIVDGIDHISRVLAHAQSVRRGDTDIVEELAALSLPDGVCLVLGSQPGAHLEPLRGAAVELSMPPWEGEEVWALAEQLHLPERLHELGYDAGEVRPTLVDRAEGNPLYATFLIRGLMEAVEHGEELPHDWLEATPALQGNIANYYEHLYAGETPDLQIVAEVLGVIDFAVTEGELGAIVGAQVARHIPAALRRLRPILLDVTGQGGLRIFHESFRRFVSERLQREGLSADVPLAGVIVWLESLGFEDNARSYRYLLPALRRTGRIDELLAHVGPDFVSRSVAAGHPRPAVERNLVLATECAGEHQRWPELVRCSELHRALHTCFEEHLLDPLPYWRSYLVVSGAEITAGRLVFDGRPVLDRHLGLVLCSIIDDANAVAPWDEYLALPPQPFRRTGGGSIDLEWVGEVVAAHIHGVMRREGEGRAMLLAVDLLDDAAAADGPVVARVADRLARSAPLASLETLIPGPPGVIPNKNRGAVLLACARRLHRQGHIAEAARFAERALPLAPSLTVAAEALRLGARELPDAFAVPDPDEFAIGLDEARYHVDVAPVESWVTVVSILAHTNPTRLEELWQAVDGEGWYRSWLRYVLQISRAEVIAHADPGAASTVAVEAFSELTRDAHPFIGRPRAMDLAMMGGTIRKSLSRGLTLLIEQDHWESALGALEAAIQGTASYFKGSFWGPIGRDVIPELLEPHAALRPELQNRVQTAIEAQLAAAERSGEYFQTHAELAFVAIRTLVAIGERQRARELWDAAAVYLGGYGQRKDITFYQLLEAVPGLPSVQDKLHALERLFPLAAAVVAHTDGRSTHHVVNACVRRLAAIDFRAALTLAARSQAAGGGRFGARTEEAADDSLHAAAQAGADPWLVSLGQATLRFAVEYEPDVLTDVGRRLLPIERLLETEPSAAAYQLRRLAARIEGDHKSDLKLARGPVAELAHQSGIRLTPSTVDVGPEAQRPDAKDQLSYGVPTRRTVLGAVAPVSSPPPDATPLQIMGWVRDATRTVPEITGPASPDRLANLIGYACMNLIQDERPDAAIRLLRYTSRQLRSYTSEDAELLAGLGAGFERYDQLKLATIAYVLAFVRARGGGGWNSFGGEEHAHWLRHALTLDADEAKRTLAAEVAQAVQGGYITGVTPGLIHQIGRWDDQDAARRSWEEAYAVVRHRLPARVGTSTTILPFLRSDIEPWSDGEALVSLILARVSHPELDRKRSALLAFAHVIQDRSEAVPRPLSRALTVDGAPTSPVLLLQTLMEAEVAPFPITRAITPVLALTAKAQHWGERIIARMLLERAGVEVPAGPEPDPVPVEQPVPPERVEAALHLDWGERIEAVASVWPELPGVVAHEFERLYFEQESAKERWKERYEFARRRESSMEFWTPILGWEQELHEGAFHNALNGVRPHLWAQGEPTAGLDRELLDRISPALRLQLALESSRSVRPQSVRAAEATDAVTEVPVLSAEDEYEGWRRVGWYEREYVFDDPMRWRNPKEIAYHAAGLLSLGIGEGPPTPGDPFGRCPDAGLWFVSPTPLTGRLLDLLVPRGVRGPLIGAVRLDDLLGNRLVLVPPPAIAVRYQLQSGPWPGPLVWVEESGDRALALRVWSVRSINAGEEPSMLKGCELIVRPDLLEKLARDAAGRLVLAGRAWRRAVRQVPDEE